MPLKSRSNSGAVRVQEFIMAAFTAGSFNPIRGIPEEIKPAAVSAARSQKVSWGQCVDSS